MTDQSLADYYAERGEAFADVYDAPALQPHLEAFAADLRTGVADRSVLELACGTGYWTTVLAERAASVVATDVDRGVLAAASESLADADHVSVVQADAYGLPVDDAFDVGFAAGWLSHVPRERREAFLGQFHDHLAPGARVWFVDTARPEYDAVRTDDAGNRYERRTVEGESFEVLKNFPDEDELRAMAEARGTDVSVVDYDHFWSLSYRVAD